MNAQTAKGDRWPLAAFLLFWAVTCIDPPYPRELVLQHVPTALAVAALLAARRAGGVSLPVVFSIRNRPATTRRHKNGHYRHAHACRSPGRRLPLSDFSARLVLVFLSLHVLGARYLYSYVPYDDWSAALFGRTVSSLCGFNRNHYDRLVHVAYGLLLFFPAREVIVARLRLRGIWADLLALQFILATSALYELIEWGVALVFAPDWAEHYNGQQGDLWDAQKDMALAVLGAVTSLLCRLALAGQVEWRGKA
jgi:putative membrane protein